MKRIHSEDMVQVICGDDKGKVAKVLRILPDKGKVVVEGVNVVFKHLRRSQKHPQGGRIQKEAPLPASKLLLVDPKSNRPTRIGFRIVDGRKVRYAKRSGEAI